MSSWSDGWDNDTGTKVVKPRCFANEKVFDEFSTACYNCPVASDCKNAIAQNRRTGAVAPNGHPLIEPVRRPDPIPAADTGSPITDFAFSLVANAIIHGFTAAIVSIGRSFGQIPSFKTRDPFENIRKPDPKKLDGER